MFLCQKHTPKLQLRQGFSYSALASPFSSAERLLKITFTTMPAISAGGDGADGASEPKFSCQAADAADQNRRDDEQVAIVAQIDRSEPSSGR